VDEDRAELLRELRRRYPPGQTISLVVSQVLHTGQAQLYPEFHDSLLSSISQDPEHYQLLRNVGIRSLLCVPLTARGRTVGAMTFFGTETDRRFSDLDLSLAEELARRCALAIDNSSLYQAEQQARSDAQAALAQRDELTSLVTHDLKNPLTSLKATVQLMQRRGEYDSRAMDRMLLQVEFLHRLIEDLAAFATLQSGRLELRPRAVELQELAKPILQQHGLLNQLHTLRLQGPEEPIVGYWDRDRLEQVFQNLIGNAVKYSPEGGEVLLRIEKGPEEARVAIHDQGLGIPESELPRLFNRFYRSDDAARAASGLGLGLFISRTLVEAHGGSIWAESGGPGEGSSFYFTLPLGVEPGVGLS
jgi:signal transduction histidine kinase